MSVWHFLPDVEPLGNLASRKRNFVPETKFGLREKEFSFPEAKLSFPEAIFCCPEARFSDMIYYACMHARITCMYVYVRICMYVCIYIYTYVCMCMYVNARMYMYACKMNECMGSNPECTELSVYC